MIVKWNNMWPKADMWMDFQETNLNHIRDIGIFLCFLKYVLQAFPEDILNLSLFQPEVCTYYISAAYIPNTMTNVLSLSFSRQVG